jgi:hypothetical protein
MAENQMQADESRRKRMKTHENEIAFFCFILFFGCGTFQRLTADSNGFFLPRRPARARPAQPARENLSRECAHRPQAPLRRRGGALTLQPCRNSFRAGLRGAL